MGSEWPRYLFEDCMDAIIDYRGKTPQKTDSGIPLITAKIIKNGAIQQVNEFIAEEDYDSWMRRGIPKSGDVVLTTEAPLGEVAQLDDRKVALAQRVITLRGKKGFLDNAFLKYLLISNDVQHQLDGRGTGTTVKGIKQSELRKLELPIPKYETQKNIAHVLVSLDNKIELNRQTNQTLEQMAQALFKSWFVDFDPVIDNALAADKPIPEELQARAQRRQQQLAKPDHQPLPDDVLQLFPSEFEETEELGWVPKGWEAGTLSSIASALSGFAFKSKDFVEKGEAVIKIKNINSDRTVDITDVNRVLAKVALSAERFLLTDGDIVMAMTGATVGKFGIIVTEEKEAYFLNQRVCKLSSKTEEGNVFLYAALNKPGVEEGIVDSAQGSAQPNISASAILSTPMVIPSTELIALFSKQMKSAYIRRITLKKEGYKLTKLRDTLLPKLISGELRLPESMLDSETNPPESAYE